MVYVHIHMVIYVDMLFPLFVEIIDFNPKS